MIKMPICKKTCFGTVSSAMCKHDPNYFFLFDGQRRLFHRSQIAEVKNEKVGNFWWKFLICKIRLYMIPPTNHHHHHHHLSPLLTLKKRGWVFMFENKILLYTIKKLVTKLYRRLLSKYNRILNQIKLT